MKHTKEWRGDEVQRRPEMMSKCYRKNEYKEIRDHNKWNGTTSKETEVRIWEKWGNKIKKTQNNKILLFLLICDALHRYKNINKEKKKVPL